MSCKTLKLRNCEIKGATFQGRRFDFVNKVITNDTFKAKVYNSEGVLKTEITGLKSGSVVYFPFTTLETYDKGNYTIRYWAEFHLLGKFNIADEDFKIANSCPNCTTQNQPYPFILDLGEDIVKFNMSFVYIQIGSGGDTDLTAYLTKEEAADTYQPKGNYASANHNHSDKANTDASNIDSYVPQWREKLRVPELPDPTSDQQELMFIPTESDAWRTISLTTNPQWVQITAPFASTLNLIPDAAGREFAGVNTKFRKNGWDGKNIFLKNDSEFDLVLKPTVTTAANTTFYTFEVEQVLKADAWKLFKIREVGGDFFLVEVSLGKDINPDLFMLVSDYVQDGKIRADKIESLALLDLIISIQTSIADFAANSGGYTFEKNDLIAVPDGSGKYSFYIYAGGVKTDVASYLAMGISNVTISQVVGLQDALTLLSNRITANETAIAGKVDKPTTDGTWSLQKLGSVFTWVSGVVQNIANTDLTNLSARIFTQGNTFTWNTAGFFHYLKGLLDKTGNAAYTKVVVLHPTTGEMVTRDFADPQATTLAVQNANSTQKTAMRTALLGTATPANPVLQDCAPKFAGHGNSYIDLYGINLTLLDPAFIWIEKPDGTKLYATNFYNLTGNAVTTQWNIPLDWPDGSYNIKIQNGVAVQGLSTAILNIVASISELTLTSSNWKLARRKMPDGVTNATGGTGGTFADNYVAISALGVTGDNSTNPAIVAKYSNIFLGSKDFDFEIEFQHTGATIDSGSYVPMIGLTETTDSGLTTANDIIWNFVAWETSITRARIISGSTMYNIGGNPGAKWWIYISKVGSKIFVRVWNKTTLTNFAYYQKDIDTTKDYALFVNGLTASNIPIRYLTIKARIMN